VGGNRGPRLPGLGAYGKVLRQPEVVYQIQSTLREWQQQGEDQQSAPVPDVPERKTDEHKLPVKANPDPRAARPAGVGFESLGGSR